MSDANRALKQDSAFDDDPFLDPAEVERRMLGDGALDDDFDDEFMSGEDEFETDAGTDDSFGRESAPAPKRAFGAGAKPAQDDFDDGFEDDFVDEFVAEDTPSAPTHEAMFEEIRNSFEAPGQDAAAVDASLYGEVDFEAPDQPIPRITVAAFCEREETQTLVQTAADDRRLSKAHVSVEMGGLTKAIDRFHDESTPNLLIVETGMRGKTLFDQLEELAGVCDPDTKVVIVGAANDIALYRELIKRGVSEYLVPPMTPLHLIKTIGELFLDPEAPFAGKTIAFIGAKGGVGSSTVAHNVAWCASEALETDSILVDMDLSFGTAGLDFNQDPAQTLGDALNEPDRLDDALLDRLLVRCTDRLNLFSAPATLERDWEFTPYAYDAVLDKVRRQAPYVVLDLPHLWMPWVKQTLLGADQVVVTAAPDLASLRNAKNLFDLVAQARPNDEPPKVVLNMAGMPKRPEIPVKDFAEALGAPPALVLPFEPQLFGKAANNGQMIRELDAKSKAADGFDYLARSLTGRSVPPRRKASLFSRLFGG